jgi:hypothetical protein
MAANSYGSSAPIAAAIIVAAVMISAAVFASPYSTMTITATQTTTNTLTVTSVQTLAQVKTSEIVCDLGSGSPAFGFGGVYTGTNSPAVICVQLYFYSATPLTLNLTSTLSIWGTHTIYNSSVGSTVIYSGASNFTVAASVPQLVIGGPSDENEGIIVAYSLTANPGVSGTYHLGFLTPGNLSTVMLTSQEPLSCGFYGLLVAGVGRPSLSLATMCITYITSSSTTICSRPTYPAACPCESDTATSSTSHSVPGIPYPLNSGYVYFRIVGVTNSTG